MTEYARQAHLNIDSRVLYDLGERLISDELQAVLELVKNSYDADASWVNVAIDTQGAYGEDDAFYRNARGYIEITDDGFGMNWKEIEDGWLLISASPKKAMKRQGLVTPKGRTPLGEKGLGRLGAQRLGRYMELWTCKEGTATTEHVGIDWDAFAEGRRLGDVPLPNEHKESDQLPGTRLVVSELRSPELWRERETREGFVADLAGLLSPFAELRPFEIELTIDGHPEPLNTAAELVLRLASLKASFAYGGGTLKVDLDIDMEMLRDRRGREFEQSFLRYIMPDQGTDFYAFLQEKLYAEYRLSSESPWFLSIGFAVPAADVMDAVLEDRETVRLADPGPFHGVIYSFPRRNLDLSEIPVFGGINEFRRYLDRNCGVRVFRDGFGVRPYGISGDDWLGLGKSSTSGGSYYELRPANVMGYVALSERDNVDLRETTSREYFVDSPHTRNFYALCSKVVEEINRHVAEIRRSFTEYTAMRHSRDAEPFGSTSEQIVEQAIKVFTAADKLVGSLPAVRTRAQGAAAVISSIIQAADDERLMRTETERRFLAQLAEARDALNDAQMVLNEAEETVETSRGIAAIAERLIADLNLAQEQLQMWSELGALGLTAEALSHEIYTAVDKLSTISGAFRDRVTRGGLSTVAALEFAEYVRDTIDRVRKQLGHLDPGLRYVRERRERIGISAFLEGVVGFYSDQFGRHGIEIVAEHHGEDFSVRMNRGKLTQVLDNLVLNAKYWLIEGLEKGYLSEAHVALVMETPYIRVWDDGRGVDPSIEHHLFEPFVTTKPRARGRGLGLFIARQLMESEGCSIFLLPQRNELGRRYIFQLDLSGAMDNG